MAGGYMRIGIVTGALCPNRDGYSPLRASHTRRILPLRLLPGQPIPLLLILGALCWETIYLAIDKVEFDDRHLFRRIQEEEGRFCQSTSNIMMLGYYNTEATAGNES